ncbi:MAG: hypothetical protein IKY04_08735, partial [Lachnospiraceae bacterium]|nr:hypothetical protein [Lachnospiraceae bacterium]
GEPGGTSGDEGGADTTGLVLMGEEPILPPAPGLAVGGAGIGGGAPAAAAEGEGTGDTIDIQQQAATSDAVPEDKAVETTDIQTQAAKAAAPINEETMSWWWLLIIAVLGGAGYAMYKKFQAKKEENKTN